ncbi:MAG: hypoxanthine phosphoribosyltransferase [Thermodesulfobacteria bacterium]|nr:hypoxanthine phosphoribosyltransferase [Thermodesulfobacteriota bacterium]
MEKLKCVISKKEIQDKVKELASKIDSEFGEEPIVFLGTLKGAFIFLSDLLRNVKNPRVEVDFVRASSYGFSDSTSGVVRLTKEPEINLKDKVVILVEDIIDTGITVAYLKEYLKKFSPKVIKVCALINKLERRAVPVEIDYVGFEVEKGFLVGYGLDFAEKYRHLPEVYEIVKEG